MAPSINIPNATTNNSGNYVLTVTGIHTCQGTATEVVTVNLIPTVTAISSAGSVAPGGSITLTATSTGIAPFTLTWSDGSVQTNVTGVTHA